MARSDKQAGVEVQMPIHFGAFLKMLRNRHGIRQSAVLACLPGWTQATYSRVETGEVAPAFDHLILLLTALQEAGVRLTPTDRQQFLLLARRRIEIKKTYQERKSDQEWDQLRLLLGQAAMSSDEPRSSLARPQLVETRHLIGREEWLEQVIASLQGELPKKLVILQGPVGIGKSSELHRLAIHFLHIEVPRPHVVLCDLLSVEEEQGPENALDMVLATVLAEVGPPDSSIYTMSLQTRITLTLQRLEKMARPFVLLVDNGEHLLDTHGQLSTCWEHFLTAFLRSEHHVSFVLATREWPGRFEGELLFLAEYQVPALTKEIGALVLYNLGLTSIANDHLQRASEAVGGIPLCLEWLASLVQEPLMADQWEESDEWEEPEEEQSIDAVRENAPTKRLLRLLEDASLFGGPIASKLTPLLDRIIETRLSADAYQVLCTLAFAPIPLGKPALQVICPRPRLLKELSIVSLLAAYPQRVQLLTMVASLMRSRLSEDQRQQREEQLITAYTSWLDNGKANKDELGGIITELTVLYLNHQRLLDAAQLLVRYGWLSFNRGDGLRIARLTFQVMKAFDWHKEDEGEFGGLLLHDLLSPFIGKAINEEKQVRDYQRVQQAAITGKILLSPSVEVIVMYHLIRHTMSMMCFEQAQKLLDITSSHLEAYTQSNLDLKVSLLEKRGWLFCLWCEYKEENGEKEVARTLREQAIAIYRECVTLLLNVRGHMSLRKRSSLKKRLARAQNNLAYHLNRIEQHKEALQAIEQSLELKEQGYVEFDTLADAYGEKAEALVGLGRFQEALVFDEKAVTEVSRLAKSGYAPSQNEISIYRINRGRLYLRLGKIDEAEALLREAIPNIPSERRMYIMFAKEALEEIEQWRRQCTSSRYQLDWRWVERYRSLVSFDAYWWLASAGPFTQEEQQQWNRLYTLSHDEAVKEQLIPLLTQSQQREVLQAIEEQRQPHLWYPALNIQEVRSRIAALQQLDSEICQHEPHVLVKQLYHATIEEELDFFYLIEATYEGNSERYWEYNLKLNPAPTFEEMNYTLSRVRQLLLQGLLRPETVQASQHVIEILQNHFQLALDLSYTQTEAQELLQGPPLPPPPSKQVITAQTAQNFFETVLRESGYDGWHVLVDANATSPRVEQGARQLFLPENNLSLNQVKDYLLHELAGHVARCVAGEHSLIGLLGIHTKNSLETEEGLATYYERQAAEVQGHVFDDSGVWFGTLATGLASGVVTPPQTFFSLFTFFEAFIFLYRLLKRPDQTVETARKQARRLALARCLRTYRGVPHLEKAGICYVKDALYLRGLWKIERALTQDKTILDRLAVGVVALEQLPMLQELGIVSAPQSLKKLALAPDLDAYILSFEEASKQNEKHV